MDRDLYFERMRETAREVNSRIGEILCSMQSAHGRALAEAVSKFGADRVRRQALLLKPYLVRLCYEASGGENWLDILPICTAVELLNISSYQANFGLDAKHRNGSLAEARACFIASMITREMADREVERLGSASDSAKGGTAFRHLSESNLRIYLGQFADTHEMVLTDSAQPLFSESEYLERYLSRCRHLSGYFTASCAELGAALAGAPTSTQQALRAFGEAFGTGLQIVNDIGDYIPAELGVLDSHKVYQDQLSDFRLRKLTGPLYYYLLSQADREQGGSGLMKARVFERTLASTEVFAIILSSGAIDRCKRIAKTFFKKAKIALHQLPRTDARDLLGIMVSSLRSNKYFWCVSDVRTRLRESSE